LALIDTSKVYLRLILCALPIKKGGHPPKHTLYYPHTWTWWNYIAQNKNKNKNKNKYKILFQREKERIDKRDGKQVRVLTQEDRTLNGEFKGIFIPSR
jgi:hypothetical protein